MGKVVNIKDFGAEANNDIMQTEKIQAAIDECFNMGGGEVIIPEGVFMTGSIRLRSNITLHLQRNAVLKGSRNPEDYYGYLTDNIEPLPEEMVTDVKWRRAELLKDNDWEFMRIAGSRWNNGLIRAVNAENISIIGEEGSCIDGDNCFDELGEEEFRGPHGISIWYCKNITLKGYSIKNTGNWAHSIYYSENLMMDNVTVLAGHDGIHMNVCKNMKIENCKFYTGDDCVAGFSNVNVFVSDCVLNSSCSAMRLGGTNAFIDNCTIYGPGKYAFRGKMSDEEKRSSAPSPTDGGRRNMLSVFTYYADYSMPIKYRPGNIVISNCKIQKADKLLHYNYSGNEWWQKNRPLKDVEFRDCEVEDIKMPSVAYGDAAEKFELKLENLNISLEKGYEDIDFLYACKCEEIKFKNVNFKNATGECVVRAWSDVDVYFKNVDMKNVKEKTKRADKEFYVDPI